MSHEIFKQLVELINQKLPVDCEATYISPYSAGRSDYRIEVPYAPIKDRLNEVEKAAREFLGNDKIEFNWVVVPNKP